MDASVFDIFRTLENVDDNGLQNNRVILQNFLAATPEGIRTRIPPTLYIQHLIKLRNAVRSLNDNELLKNAGKMAGYIIKNQPQFSIFPTFLEDSIKLDS